MSENTQVATTKSRSSRKKVGSSSEPCPVSNPDKQLVVLVAASGVGPLDGIAIRVIDAKKKSKNKSSAKGIAVFTGLAPGACTIETRLSSSQAKAYLPGNATAEVKSDGFVEVVLKLETTSLDLRPKLTCRSPDGVFEPVGQKGEKIRVNLSLAGGPLPKGRCTVTLKRQGRDARVFSDAAGTQELTFISDSADIDRAKFAGEAAVAIWVASNTKNAVTLTLCVEPDPTSAPRGKTVAMPVAAQSAPLKLTWHDPALLPSVDAVGTLVLGSPFEARGAIADLDKIGTTATIAVHDKDEAKVLVLGAPLTLGTEMANAWTRPWDGKDDKGAPVLLEKSPYQIHVEITDRFGRKLTEKKPFSMTPPQSHIALKFKDPEGVERALPEGLPVELVFGDGSVDKIKLGAGGLLLGTDGKAGAILDPLRKDVTLRIPKADATYVVCEPHGQPVAAALLKTAEELKAWVADPAPAKKGARAFLLPAVDWTLAESVWTATDDDSRFNAIGGMLKAHGLPIGKPEAPAKLVLDARWQYARFTYQDRVRLGDEQVSSLPLFISGFAARPAKKDELPATRSNWTFGATPEKAVQCLPWIIRATDVAKVAPTNASELRFETAKDTFIETPLKKEDPRAWSIGTARATAGADRLRFYDLPAEWRSQNWYLRKVAKGSDATGKFFFELASTAEVLATKDAPNIFSLDDLVLYECKDPSKPAEITPLAALAAGQPVAVFHHTFATGTDLSPEGIFLPSAAPEKGTLAKVEHVRWPASKDDVLVRAGASGRPLKENYVYRYADWSRLLIAEGAVFDVFAQRSAPIDTDADHVVGARAAVRLANPAAPMDGVTPDGSNTPGKHSPRPKSEVTPRPAAIKSEYLTVQPLLEFARPIANRRPDFMRVATGGFPLSTDATDFKQRYGRPTARMDEHKTPEDVAKISVIGRFDGTLIRCCGLDLTDPKKPIEKAVQLSYFRLSCDFDGTSAANDETKRGDWIKRSMTGMNLRWNGPDGAFNPGRPIIEPRDLETRDDKFTVQAMRVFQNVPDELAAIRFKVIGKKPGARDYMNTYYGETQAQDGNEKPSTEGTFTAAHEMGHGGGLLDDYCELWNHASYEQPGVPMLVPGDPYIFDDIDGSASMMHGNQEVRGRHYWQMAEWVRGQLKTEVALQVRHGDAKPFFLPHHKSNRTGTPTSYRSFLTFPWSAAFDVPDAVTPAKKARYDAYLYVLGDDFYSKTVLPGRAGDDYSKQHCDGVLVIAVAICLNFDGLIDHVLMMHAAGSVVTTLRKQFSDRVHAAFEVGGHKFERCQVVLSPRIVVGTHAGDEAYDKGLGINKNGTAVPWEANMEYFLKDTVHPTVDNGFVYTCVEETNPGASGSGLAEPVWPTTKDATVMDDEVKWKAVPASEARKLEYDKVLASKLNFNPLHVVVEMGAAVSEMVEPPTALPRIRIASQQLEVWRELSALGTLINKVQQETRKRLDDLSGTLRTEYTVANTAYNTAKLENTTATGLYNTALLDFQTKDRAYNNSGASGRQPANPLWLAANTAWCESERTRLIAVQKAQLETQKLGLRDTAAGKFNAAVLARDTVRIATSIGQLLAKAKAMGDALFNADSNPLTDAGYTDLKSQIGLLAAEGARSGATRDTVCGKLASTQAAVVAAKEALEVLAPETAAKDAAAVGAQLLVVAEKLEAWAKLGADDKDKKARATDAKKALKAMADEAASSRTKRFNALKTQVAGGWSTLNYTKASAISDAERGCASQVVGDLRGLYLKDAPATLEEQLTSHFASWLGVEAKPHSQAGYLELVKSVADVSKPIALHIPRPPPPPTFTPSTPTSSGPIVVATTPPLGFAEALLESRSKLTPPKPLPPLPPKPEELK